MLTKSLRLNGYRAFEHFEIDDLARVNLFVGKNGCGKTSILEAVQILASQGAIKVLTDINRRRGEFLTLNNHVTGRHGSFPLLRFFFCGREIVLGKYFEISGDSSVEKFRAEIGDISNHADLLRSLDEDFAPHFSFELADNVYSLTNNGVLFDRPIPRPGGSARVPHAVQFVGAESLSINQMGKVWDQVILSSQESDVVDAMRILDPAIENVFFLSNTPAAGVPGTVFLSFDDERGRIPLGSSGEGMRRLLALALALAQAKGGILLIDEIDTGLHYSVLGRMWLLIAEAARKSGTQVFATTHSLDCVKSLAWLCENHPELSKEVALHKIDASLDHSVAFDAEQIAIASEQGIEVR